MKDPEDRTIFAGRMRSVNDFRKRWADVVIVVGSLFLLPSTIVADNRIYAAVHESVIDGASIELVNIGFPPFGIFVTVCLRIGTTIRQPYRGPQ